MSSVYDPLDVRQYSLAELEAFVEVAQSYNTYVASHLFTDEALQLARWELAAVRALEAGEPLPPRRGPCFFNPQHGPAVARLDWAPPHGSSRRVEVCRGCELRVETGADPAHREVRVGDRYVPWWQAPSAAHFTSMPLAESVEHGPLVTAALTEARIHASLAGISITVRG